MKRGIVVAAAALLTAGCATEYTYTPPATAEGRACVARCQGTQQACRHNQDQRADDAQTQCEADAHGREERCENEASIEYLACLKYARTDAERKACQKKDCTQPSCDRVASYGLCDSDYRACYENCGGKVDVRD